VAFYDEFSLELVVGYFIRNIPVELEHAAWVDATVS
jgi:ABC-type glycerol-3-phosphate transport system permease component